MMRHGIVSFLLLSGFSSCLLVPAGPVDVTGDVTFSWTFEGRSCAAAPEVYQLSISIPELGPTGNVSMGCRDSRGFDGAMVRRVPPGSYTFRMEAYDFSNRLRYVAAGSFTVNGNSMQWVDLTSPHQANSFAYVSWSFPSNGQVHYPSCSQAGVRFVDMRIDGSPYTRFDCEAGQYGNSIRTPYLFDGSHTIELVALTHELYSMYSYVGPLATFGGAPVSNDITFRWAVGGAAISWSLIHQGSTLTCWQAQVTTVRVDFLDEFGNWIYGKAGDVQACDASPVVYNYLQPGKYQVFVSGFAANGAILFQSNPSVPPTVWVRAGLFSTPQDAFYVPMYRN